MNKKQVQQRILRKGKTISLNDFTWEDETLTLSSYLNNLVIDFTGINDATIKCGNSATIECGHDATIKCFNYSNIKCGDDATINCRHDATIKCGDDANIKCGIGATIKCRTGATIKCGYSSTINCGDDATIKCGNSATIECEDSATIKCGHDATINCQGHECVIINRYRHEVIQPKKNDIIETCPVRIEGHLINGIKDGKPHIIADGILSEIINQKGSIYKVINRGETKQSYLIKNGDKYSHGETLKEAKESLVYKLADLDTSKYKNLTTDSVLTKDEIIECYMTITGACANGTKYFVDQNKDKLKDKFTIQEIIDLTKDQYGSGKFNRFFN